VSTPRTAARSRRRLLFTASAAAVVLSLGVAAVLFVRAFERPPAAAHWRPPPLPAASGAAPLTLTGAGGRRITCPIGSEPAVMITEGTFNPSLVRGSTMNRGRYLIRLRGTVNNETGAAVDVRKIIASVRGRFWPAARITVQHTIPPQSSVPLVIEGAYVSSANGPVAVRTHFDWRWHDADLADCGESGLTEDD
jgi:hypothetical protein